jgi:Skp family chaperone for outer membrane proteins
MFKVKSIFIAAFLSCFGFYKAFPKEESQALATQSIKIAVLDLNLLLQESKAAESINSKIEEKRASFQQEIQKFENQLRSLEEKLVKEQKQSPAQDFEAKRNDFEKKVAEVQQKVSQRRTQLAKAFEEAMIILQKKIMELVVKIAEREKYALIVPRSTVIFRQDNLEITEEVMTLLNKELPDVQVVIPAIDKDQVGQNS